jgi:hypothetical protein
MRSQCQTFNQGVSQIGWGDLEIKDRLEIVRFGWTISDRRGRCKCFYFSTGMNLAVHCIILLCTLVDNHLKLCYIYDARATHHRSSMALTSLIYWCKQKAVHSSYKLWGYKKIGRAICEVLKYVVSRVREARYTAENMIYYSSSSRYLGSLGTSWTQQTMITLVDKLRDSHPYEQCSTFLNNNKKQESFFFVFRITDWRK